jgi:hypothetical protein
MEIKRLPLGQSHAERIRAGTLRWKGKPPGITQEMADEFMLSLAKRFEI